MELKSIYNHLINLGIIDKSISLVPIFNEAIFSDNMIGPFLDLQESNSHLTMEEFEDEEIEEDDWSYISLNSSMSIDLNYKILIGKSEIILHKNELENTIGHIDFKIFNTFLLSTNELWDAADSSVDEHWIFSIFFELFKDEFELYSPKFLMLNKILIEDEFRNKGYGKEAIKELIQFCEILDMNYIVLKPSPIEDVDFSDKHREKRNAEIERLISFYEQLNFDTYILDDQEPIMVFDFVLE